VKRAMEIVVALGEIYGAEDLVPVESVQVAGVSYKNLGQAGLEFLREWAAQGARVRVPTTLNPAGMDLADWRRLGIPEDFARRQIEVIEAFRAMGIAPTCSCTPYLIGNIPRFGQHIAWSESSAVSFANSVLGARTNREGGPSALAAAIVGRTARYGLHLDENRVARYVIEVRCAVESEADYGALGYLVGKEVKDGVPYFRGIGKNGQISDAQPLIPLKALGAAMAASGAVALYHVEGITPEARAGEVIAPGARTIVVEGLEEGYAALNTSLKDIDFVSIGCPHASLEEIAAIATWLEGKQVKAKLWVTTAQRTKEMARKRGWVEIIEAAGGQVVADTCLVVAPVQTLGVRNMATNSAKAAFYAPSHSHLNVRYGTLERCLEAAVTGRWPSQ
jgi:predicted aconitase